ncbi:hypothetical protein [Lewinella sp. W8]|uniref:hypothetical protein n=1 Tax=Lewinella sp. W8 TaxID=2528208 RepID=UPI0010681DDF|nr:hypothetical protein [Lewinella sp. W8]MTB51256.1 hypothetical protein [Lewinella sp. W8]
MIRYPWFLAFFGLLFFTSCQTDDRPPEERYAEALAAGLASKTVTNDLFLGLELDMTDQEFYDQCTRLNQQKKIVMGSGGNRVNYAMSEELDRPATMTFYPDFSKDDPRRILAMDLEISYDDWSPWNRDASSAALIKDLYTYVKEEYGNDIIPVPDDRYKVIFTQVKNNRRIAFWIKDERIVRVRITDLRALPEEPLGL